ERIAEQYERLAHHALHGELWEKAVAYLHQAGLRAMARGAHREAVPYLEQALGALRHLPETRQRSELAIDIRIDARTALNPLGDWARMLDHLQEAEVLARSLGDQHRLGRSPPSCCSSTFSLATTTRPSDSGKTPSPSHAPSAIARSRWSQRPILAS